MRSSIKQIRLAEYETEITALICSHKNPQKRQLIIQQCLGLSPTDEFKVLPENKLRDCIEIVDSLVNFGFYEINKVKNLYPKWVLELVISNRLGNEDSVYECDVIMQRRNFELKLKKDYQLSLPKLNP